MSDKEASAAAPAQTKEEDDGCNIEEEVTEGNWTRPEVEVHEVRVETGEEGEDLFWKCRAKLYRWASGGEWKERGLGEAKLLQDKETNKIRFLLRQEKTLKIVANHYVVATDVYCKLAPNVSSEKIWVWTVMDFADGQLKNEQFALKFGQIEKAKEFKEKFGEAAEINAKLFGIVDKKTAASSLEVGSEDAPQDPSYSDEDDPPSPEANGNSETANEDEKKHPSSS